MIVAKIQGGLGNQLFQYSYARTLSHLYNTPLKLDISSYDPNPENKSRDRELGRLYVLDKFNTVGTIATQDEIRAFQKYKRKPGHYIHNRLVANKSIYIEEIAGFNDAYKNPPQLKKERDIYVEGYWLTEKYFLDTKDLLHKELTVKTAPDVSNKALLEAMAGSESVCLHVRRGDFASPKYHAVNGLLSLAYYQTALETLKPNVKNPHLFIFSDDIPWVKEHMPFAYPTTYVEHNGPEKDYEDLRLMSACKYFVIANSSFSWWGAWLATYPGKIVVAPDKLRMGKTWKDYIPDGWVQIKTELI